MANYRLCNVTIKHGNEVDLPPLKTGEPAYCTDTKELYIGNGVENEPTGMMKQVDSKIKEALKDLSDTLAKLTEQSNNFKADIMDNNNSYLGTIRIDKSGILVTNAKGESCFSIDKNFRTSIKDLYVENIDLSSTDFNYTKYTLGDTTTSKKVYAYMSPRGSGNRTGVDKVNKANNVRVLLNNISKVYGWKEEQYELVIVLEPGLYLDNFIIDTVPGGLSQISLVSDVNGDITLSGILDIRCRQIVKVKGSDVFGKIKIQGLKKVDEDGSSISSPYSCNICNTLVEFHYCHFMQSEDPKNVKSVFNMMDRADVVLYECDIYGYKYLFRKAGSVNRMCIQHCTGNLNAVSTANFMPGIQMIYQNGTVPIFDTGYPSECWHGTATPTKSIYKIESGDSGGTVKPPTQTTTNINIVDIYGSESMTKKTVVVNQGLNWIPITFSGLIKQGLNFDYGNVTDPDNYPNMHLGVATFTYTMKQRLNEIKVGMNKNEIKDVRVYLEIQRADNNVGSDSKTYPSFEYPIYTIPTTGKIDISTLMSNEHEIDIGLNKGDSCKFELGTLTTRDSWDTKLKNAILNGTTDCIQFFTSKYVTDPTDYYMEISNVQLTIQYTKQVIVVS